VVDNNKIGLLPFVGELFRHLRIIRERSESGWELIRIRFDLNSPAAGVIELGEPRGLQKKLIF